MVGVSGRKRRWRLVAVGSLLAVLLAGCVGEDMPGPAKPAEGVPATEAAVDERSGGIEGTVTDDALTPIRDAEVALDDLDRTTKTDDAGRFAFSGVPPGRFRVVAGKIGYEAGARAVDVEVGQIAKVSFALTPLAVEEPSHKTIRQEGFIGCGVNARHPLDPGGTENFVAACGPLYYNVSPDLDRFRLDWSVGPTKELAGLWAETTWRSTQPAGHGLFVWWAFFGSPIATLAKPTGTSPLVARVEADSVTGSGCPAKFCTITSFHYSYANTIGPSSPVDVGVTLQQRLTDYVTVFRGGDLPERFSALPPP
ncbi:MAG: carboxypeptidase regulatory-like domain-containing protein [Euryarchaeota archaeon]|nr:carboxypeptidase regulatory-like domain-containing protein [Euryarchaeota archaeon]